MKMIQDKCLSKNSMECSALEADVSRGFILECNVHPERNISLDTVPQFVLHIKGCT